MNREKIEIVNLYLDLKNPRQETKTQEEAIDWLCENEKVEELAKDIVEIGLSPLELPATLKINENYWSVLEGNRRICALKLLLEPELAPNLKTKNKFIQLNSRWENKIVELECVSFETREESDIWLDRLHIGQQDGLGRVKWNATQIQRRSDRPENKRAIMVLDYAVKNDWVSEDAINSKLTTATRYLNNQKFRNSIGLGNSFLDLAYCRPLNVFNNSLKTFVDDLINNDVNGNVSSRASKIKIERYGDKILSKITDLTFHEEKSILQTITEKKTSTKNPTKKSKPTKPSSPPKILIVHNTKLESCLNNFGNTKLKSLYYSLCVLDLNISHHVPLATVGAWSFVESLTKVCGRSDGVAFKDFISSKIQSNFTGDTRGIKAALKDLESLGNLTKHDSTYAVFNGEAITSIMEIISPVLVFLFDQNSIKN